MSICTGAELGISSVDGSLRVRNAQPGTWPGTTGVCDPSTSGDLYKDPALGLWVPPVEFQVYHQRIDTGQIESPLAFGAWKVNTATVPASALPVSACSAQQLCVLSTFTINATVPQNAGLAWTLSAGITPTPSMPPSGYLEHGRFKGWADSGAPAGTTYQMARTDTLSRYAANAAGAAVTLYQWQAVTAFEHGTGVALPTINRLIIETTVYAFDTATAASSGPL